MLLFSITLVAFAASALAIIIETPSNWTSSGPNELKFETVATDPTSFAIALVNQNTTFLSDPIVLVQNQSASSTSVMVSPDCNLVTAYPVGGGFQVNFVRDAQSLDSIIGQSNLFNITQSSDTTCDSSSSTAAATATETTAASTPTERAADDQPAAGFATTSLSTSAIVLALVGHF
ncbi:hypothetical protein BDY24DRAFT_443178 [Mrakia frigida]|uniref:GPI anchored serine-threonine rich family protein n=1 Tax=Mrakia frigida TaxID=29902 RepID=UPI003FCBFBDE